MEKFETGLDRKSGPPSEKYDDEFVPSPGPSGMDPPPSIGQLPPPPLLDDMKCRKGPCKHYWHLVTPFAAGNPDGTFAPGEEPKHHHHVCLVNPGMETTFSDDAALECNKWEPYSIFARFWRQLKGMK